MKWELIEGLIATFGVTDANEYLKDNDQASYFHWHRLGLWVNKKAPLYCIDREIFKALNGTETENKKELLKDLPTPIPTLMMLLPQGSIVSPEGGELDYLLIHVSDREHPEWSYAPGLPYLATECPIVIQAMGIDTKRTTWFFGIGFDRTTGEVQPDRRDVGKQETNEADSQFLDRMRSLTLQILLLLAYQPELIEVPQQSKKRHPKAKSKGQRKSEFANPRWIGKGYKHPVARSNGTGTHASPRTHWRIGHWRSQACGEKYQDRKILWIKPTIING